MTIRFTEGDGEPERDAAAAGDVLAFTEELFRIAMSDLNGALMAIREGRYDASKAGKTAIRDLAQMGLQVLEERRNVEKFRKQLAGAVGARGELDLDAARDEIGRRLALLRDARGD